MKGEMGGRPQSSGDFGVGQLRSTLTVLITSLTTPHSGTLMHTASASLSAMLISFSAHGIGFSSGRIASDQLAALESSSAARNASRSTPSAAPSLSPSSLAEIDAHRMRLLTILPT